MCDSCGCADTTHVGRGAAPRTETVSLRQSLLADNDADARRNRARLTTAGTLCVNLMSSPGAGKTALLEATIDALKDELRIAVIEGDLETQRDAERIRARGVPALQITTGGACHLDARMVADGLVRLGAAPIDILFVENVGNLVCPASFDLGQHASVTLLAATEGDDKPAKYPVIFRKSALVLITKCDLLPVLDDFSPQRARAFLRDVAGDVAVLELSARRQVGLEAWFAWLRAQRQQLGDAMRRPLRYRAHGATGGAGAAIAIGRTP